MQIPCILGSQLLMCEHIAIVDRIGETDHFLPKKCISSGGNVLGKVYRSSPTALSSFSETLLMSGSVSDFSVAAIVLLRLNNRG